MVKIIMHVDMNAFFVTCEEIRDPSLVGKPVLIGHTGRSGIVSTASYAARKYGCQSGMPMFQALKLCPSAIVVPPHFDFYNVMSNSFFAYLENYSRIIERASIDEGYVDMTAPLSSCKDPIGYLRALQNGLKKETGLGCSIGIAPTKWLAKMASDLQKPMGLTIIRKREIPTKIMPLPIEKFWGIGKKTVPRLRQYGIQTIGDFAAMLKTSDVLRKEMGKFATTCEQWLSGEGDDVVDTSPFDPKSIGNSETLMRDCQGFREVKETLLSLCKEVASRAKEAKKVAYTVALTVKDTSFRTHSKRHTFDFPISTYEAIFERIESLYRANYEEMEVRLVGVTLEKLSDPVKDDVQMSLWNYEEYERMDETKLLINELNRKMDTPLLMRGSEAKNKKKGDKDGH